MVPFKVMPVIETFLEAPAERLPIATAKTGYYPGKTK